MDIDQEHLGIPDTAYDATVTMSSAEFARICRDLTALGESVRIEASKEGVRFSAEGEVGTGTVLLKQTAGKDRVKQGSAAPQAVKRDPDEEEDEEEEKEDEEEEEGGQYASAESAPLTSAEDEIEEARSAAKKRKSNGKAPAAKKVRLVVV